MSLAEGQRLGPYEVLGRIGAGGLGEVYRARDLGTRASPHLWALGLLIYEMLTGRRAFEGKSQVSLIGAILEREPEPLARLQPLTPPSLERLVKRCLAKSPDDRWDTAHDVADELRWIADAGTAAAESTQHKPRWKRTLALAVPAIVCLLLGALAERWLRERVTPASPVVHALLDVQPAEEMPSTRATSTAGSSSSCARACSWPRPSIWRA